MPWPDRDALGHALSGRSFPRATLECLIFGQGVAEPDKHWFADFRKRLDIASFIEDLGHRAAFPEHYIEAAGDFLAEEMSLSQKFDVLIALQPLNTIQGAPTLRSELQDIAGDPALRARAWLFQPDNDRFHTFDSVVLRLPSAQVHSYRPDIYETCKEIRDLLTQVIQTLALAKARGEWPPQTALS